MQLNPQRIRSYLDTQCFEDLFVEELGWSAPSLTQPTDFEVGDEQFTHKQIAELGGVVVFRVTSDSGEIPDARMRERIYREVEKAHRELLLIFVNAAGTQSLWYYARRENGKLRPRLHLYVQGQPLDLFLAKLAGITFDLSDFDETGRVPLLRVTQDLRRAFDVEQVTKKFYKAFRDQHYALIEAIQGIADEGERRWYASVLLTRLMFVYFLQKKGFLDGGNRFYLEDKLDESKKELGRNKFYKGYFQELIQALFFQGLAKQKGERDPEIVARIGDVPYLNGVKLLSNTFRSGFGYEHQTAEVDGRKVGSDYNLYKLFLERCYHLLRDDGRCGILVPSGVYSDLGAKGLRQLLFDACEVNTLFGLSNERFLFDDVDHRFQFVILSFEKGGETERFEAAFRYNPREAIGKNALADFLEDETEHVHIRTALIRRLSPSSLSVLEFRSETDKEIAEKMARFPSLGEEVEGKQQVHLDSEFHVGNYSYLFLDKPKPARLPLYEGKMIHQFDHTLSPPTRWVDEKAGRAALTKRGMEDTGQPYNYQTYRLAFRAIARTTDARTMIATIIPPAFHGDRLPSVRVFDEQGRRLISNAMLLYLCGVWNSYVLDWLLRMMVSTTLNFFYIYQLSVPRLEEGDPCFRPVVERTARLVCTTPEFDALAREVGLRGHQDGVRDPDERSQLRAELDAHVAHLYGLSRQELEHVLATFPLVEDAQKAAVLSAYGALADAAQAPPDDPGTAALVANGEGNRLELKATLRRALNPQIPDHVIEHAVLKTIAAFLNTGGGTLLVGVSDDGQPLGLDADGFPSEDKLLLHLRNLIAQRLSLAAFRHLSYHIVDLGGKRILRVDVQPADAPVYLKEKGGGEAFYVRTGPSTIELSLSEAIDYVGHTFPRAK